MQKDTLSSQSLNNEQSHGDLGVVCGLLVPEARTSPLTTHLTYIKLGNWWQKPDQRG